LPRFFSFDVVSEKVGFFNSKKGDGYELEKNKFFYDFLANHRFVPVPNFMLHRE
jgi:hypothetical protein